MIISTSGILNRIAIKKCFTFYLCLSMKRKQLQSLDPADVLQTFT